MPTARRSLPLPTALLFVDSRSRGSDVWENPRCARSPDTPVQTDSVPLRPRAMRLAGVQRLVAEVPKLLGYHLVTFVIGMQSVLTHAFISEADFDVGYVGVGRQRGDVTCYSAQIRSVDPLGVRGVPEPHRAHDGVLRGTQARDLPDYGIPVP